MIKRQIACAIIEKRQVTQTLMEKGQITGAIMKIGENMCYHDKKTDNISYDRKTDRWHVLLRQKDRLIDKKIGENMCYHEKKTDGMHYHGKNTFLAPFFFKIVKRFRVAHINHRTFNTKVERFTIIRKYCIR